MTIEIKQLLIKSNIVQRTDSQGTNFLEERRVFKEELLIACRYLIMDILREKGER